MEIQQTAHEPMDVNSESDSSSSEDEEEQILINKAEELERAIADDKYLYIAHEELVTLYRKLGDLKSMRLAYERFHKYFPLTPEIWLAWISDEKKIANSETEVKNIFTLFDKAVEDYLSVSVWVEYAQYSIGASNLEVTRTIIERGLTAAGLHTAEGSLLWDTLRELEFAHLSLVSEGSEQWKEQILKVVEVFKRQLSVPLIGMESSYNEWTEWLKQLPEGHNINAQPVEWGYNKALKTLGTYRPFEDQLQAAADDSELFQIYKDYIKFLSDPSTIMCVYERAVAQLCLNVNIWQDYCLYAMKFGDSADKISARALRNCPWSEDLWITRLRILEYLEKTENEVMTCFEQGMANVGGLGGAELWLAYLEYANRTLDNKEKIYKLFDQAIDQLVYKEEGSVKVKKWYARVVAKNGDMPTARRLWREILKIPRNKGVATVWLEYANLERQYGEPNQLRSLFQRALTNCVDWPQYIAEEWLMFEREFGKLSDVIKCVEKRNEVTAKLAQENLMSTNKVTQESSTKRKLQDDENVKSKRTKNEDTQISPRKVPIVKDPKTTVFISNLYPSINEKRLKKVFPSAVNIELVVDRKGKSRCYGYIQFSMEEEVLHALARDRELLDGRPIFISNCKPDRNERKSAFKYSAEEESNKLFVKGLPVDKTQEDVENIFKPHGAVSVRLVLHKSGQPKGLAYVEFENEEAAKKAKQKTDQMKIGEHTITVAISAPPPKSQKKKSTSPTRHARSRLQMPMIPRSLQVRSDGSANGENKSTPSKSNDDFRKMLFNK